MKKSFVLLLIVLAIGIYFVVRNGNSGSENIVKYTTRETPLTFEYDKNAYVLTEVPPSVTLMLKEDYESIQRGERAGGEGPPVITIRRIDNPNNPSARTWAEQYPPQSNFNLKTSPVTETTISGLPAIRYTADGLYPNKNVIIEAPYWLFYVNGQYLDQSSRLYSDFEKILDSIETK